MKMLIIAIAAFAAFLPHLEAKPKKQELPFDKDEAVLNAVAATRIGVIEKATGFVFDKNTRPKVLIKNMWTVDENGTRSRTAEYECTDQTVRISTSLWSAIEGTLGKELATATVAEVLEDTYFIPILDHELGHLLADQISRRNRLGKWYTTRHYDSLTPEQCTGLKAVNEGFSMWVQYTLHPNRKAEKHCERCFPKSCGPDHDTTSICYDGGYWLVKDVIRGHGVRGLIWLIRNPLTLRVASVQADAVAYRKRALGELGRR